MYKNINIYFFHSDKYSVCKCKYFTVQSNAYMDF